MMNKRIKSEIFKLKNPFHNLPRPSKEAIIESKMIIKRLKEELDGEKIKKVQENIVRCHLG